MQIANTEQFYPEVLNDEAYQKQLAKDLVEQSFGNGENVVKTGNVITSFVASYEAHKHEMPLEVWLQYEFKKYPEVWSDEQEIVDTTWEVIDSVKAQSQAKESLYAHLDKSKSKESWIANQIERGATLAGVADVGKYVAGIDRAIEQANSEMFNTVTRNDGSFNFGRNLDGFIAEQHHVDTFNLNAAAQKSTARAKVLVPDGAYGKNSVDIAIYDDSGNLVKKYQAKYGQDAFSTEKLFDSGDYRGQQKLVPGEQIEKISGSTGHIEYDGVKSTPLSKAEAKALQEKVQLESEAKQYAWNDTNKVTIVKEIGKGALLAAGLTCVFQGARVLGRRTWNSLTGKENATVSEDIKEFFESSIKSGLNIGAQVAVCGAVVIAVKNGWFGKVAKGFKANVIVNTVVLGMENAKILYKFAKGELTGIEMLDALSNTNYSLLGGIIGANNGMTLGTTIGLALGPIGGAIGGFVGGMIGGIAGSKIGEKIYQAEKEITKTGVKIVSAVCAAVKETGIAVWDGVKSIVSLVNPFSILA